MYFQEQVRGCSCSNLWAPLHFYENQPAAKFLKMGCENLEFNTAVLEFALSVKEQGIKTAVVTGHMDVFTKVIVPSHRDESIGVVGNWDRI